MLNSQLRDSFSGDLYFRVPISEINDLTIRTAVNDCYEVWNNQMKARWQISWVGGMSVLCCVNGNNTKDENHAHPVLWSRA